SLTIPHRRRICCWAKSTLFNNPFSGALLRSSGSIPVRRNPNSMGSHGGPGSLSCASSTTSQADLFKNTSVALARGEVVGLFPEGTSYTEPAIAQVKEGAAWAAIEYVKAVAARRATGEGGEDLPVIIVPAAIVYTDKSRYQSQVCLAILAYGKPIRVDGFLDLEDDDSVRALVKDITGEIYQRLKEMTINAPDWDTFNSAKIAAEVAWGEAPSISKYVGVSQTFVELLSGESQEILDMRQPLVKYLGLLHYTGISHGALDYLYPLPAAITPTVPIAILTVLCQLCKTFLHPSAVAFLPMFVLYLPMYIASWLAVRFLTKPDEEEAKAQFKAVFGGLGIGLSYGVVTRIVFRTLMPVGGKDWIAIFPTFFIAAIGVLVGMVAVTVGTVRILWKWHNSLVKGKPRCYAVFPSSADFLVAYSRPPPPAGNPFIKRVAMDQSAKTVSPPSISATKLIRPLFVARVNAVDAVRKLEAVGKDGERRLESGKDEPRELPNKGSD
ncbi:acyltransferase, partial [Boletus edulis]